MGKSQSPMPTARQREEALFRAAAELRPGAARGAFLDQACAGDPTLRQRLESLLAAHAERDEPSPKGAPAVIATIKLDLPDAEDEAVGQMLGRYKLLERVGEGGCGVVYVAEQTEPVRRRVALKVIKLGMDTKQVVARFEAERQALAMMDHANIAKVLDAGSTETGRPFFVMELVRGIKITDYCDQANLSTKERLELFIKVCQAIQHAHQKGIIHRDIKPSNILVTLHDGVPVPKVIDFGIAKATEGRLTDNTVYTQLHQFIGTPAYMSPEQAEMSGLDIDTRSDIYSLGVLLYELLVGSTPFDAKELISQGIDAMRKTIREKEPVRPSTRLATLKGEELTTTAKRRSAESSKLLHQLKGDLDWIVMKCLEKDRTRRYDTANGLAMDLKRHLNNEPVVARPPSRLYEFQKAVRRHKFGFAAATALIIVLAVGVLISTWQAIAASRARSAEQQQRLATQIERDKALTAEQAEKRARLQADAEKAEANHLLYVANMNLAQQAWDENNIGRLRQLLEDTQDSPHRGFEWYYWQGQAHLSLRTFRGHRDGVRCAAYSPDGVRIVTASDDGTAKVWEAAGGKELLTLNGHGGSAFCAVFSLDSQRIVTASRDGIARVWEAASGRELLSLAGHGGVVRSAAWSPDGQRIATGSWDRTAKVWEAATGKELLTLKGHSDAVFSVAFSPDSRRIVTGSVDETARVWETSTGKELLALKGHARQLTSAAFSPDGQRIVTGSWDNTAKVWEAAGGRELLTLKGHSHGVLSVSFSPDGQRIVTGSSDNTARVWEAATGKELLSLKGHSGGVSSVAFSPDGQQILTGSYDNTAKLWEAPGGLSGDVPNRNLRTLKGHKSGLFSVAISPDGQRVATGSWDEAAKVWETASGRELLTLKVHGGAVAFSPDGQRLAAGNWNEAKVWEVASGREFLTFRRHDGGVSSLAFSHDGRQIVTGSDDGTAKVWEAATGRELRTFRGHSDGVRSVSFAPNGQRVVTGSKDRTAKVWEVAGGRELLTLKGHNGEVWSVAFSPDSQQIVTGSHDNTAKVWEAATGREMLTLNGHSDWIQSVAFSSDGRRILTGSDDGTAKLWEAATGRELLTLKGHGDGVFSVAISPDGQRIVTGSDDRTAKVWAAAPAEQVAVWQQEERAAAQALAAVQREQTAEAERQRIARSRDSIKQWLILAPIPLASGQSGTAGLDIEQIEGEGQLRPKAGEARSAGGGELKWREVALEDYVIDFNAILGQETTRSVAYAVCYLQSESEQRGLQMLVGSDDEAKVYLNGKEVFKFPIPRTYGAEQDRVPDISLHAGLNVLVLKVVNETVDWMGSIRFTDALGNPVKGIKVTLDPEAKDSP
jgi:eukaryotic-like serine/threonine-protein kinase